MATWDEIAARLAENEQDPKQKAAPLRRTFFEILEDAPITAGKGATKKMVSMEFGSGHRLLWEIGQPAENFFLEAAWAKRLRAAGFIVSERPFQHGVKDGGRHSALSRSWSFGQTDCIAVRISSGEELSKLLGELIGHGMQIVLHDEVIDEWIEKLGALFPGLQRFDQPHAGFDDAERNYKISIAEQLRAAIEAGGEQKTIANAVHDALATSNILQWRTYWAISPKGDADKDHLYPALIDFLQAIDANPLDHPDALAKFVDAWMRFVPNAQLDHARQVGEFLLMHLQPHSAAYIRHTVRQDLWLEATGRPFPNKRGVAAVYRTELGFMEAVRNAFAARGLAPRDMIDIQGALWAIHNYKGGPMNTKAKPRTSSKPSNRILYGPPGTGKTYATAQIAVGICDGWLADSADDQRERDAVIRRYRELVSEGRIEFVTFHQSFSYEEFVEGLRPETNEDSDGGFRLAPRPGVFKRIAKRANELGSSTSSDFKPGDVSVFKMSLGRANTESDAYLFDECLDGGYVLLGWGGEIDWSDPSFERYEAIKRRWLEDEPGTNGNNPNIAQLYSLRGAMKEGDLIVISNGNSRFRAVGRITGPYEFVDREDGYRHRRKVDWLWSDFDGGLPREEIYRRGFSQQSAYRLADEAINWSSLNALVADDDGDQAPRLPHVLIIDEINRGNISKILGELITLLEPDKRIGEPNELRTRLPYSGELFGVPSNLHVIGTMNTADRSIALLDTALRRRFEFMELQPDPSCVPEFVDDVSLRHVFGTLNDRIEQLFDRDHTIGHAYLMHCQSREDVDRAMRERVIPLLVEYFYEDWEKVRQVLGEREDDGSFLIRSPLNALPDGSGSYGETRYRYQVRQNFAQNAYEQLVT